MLDNESHPENSADAHEQNERRKYHGGDSGSPRFLRTVHHGFSGLARRVEDLDMPMPADLIRAGESSSADKDPCRRPARVGDFDDGAIGFMRLAAVRRVGFEVHDRHLRVDGAECPSDQERRVEKSQ